MSAPKRERTLVLRRRVLLGVWLLANAALVSRAVQVQVVQGAQWQEAAESQHRTTRAVAAPRGRILDRDGVPLALSREVVRVSVAPAEISDVEEVRALLVDVLRLSPAEARRHTDPAKRWSVISGTYEPAVLESLSGVRGLHVERTHQRFYPRGDLARGVLGAVIDGQGAGGIEQVFEEVLRGHTGREVAARDNQGKEIPGEAILVEAPVAGGDVRLTLDVDLQEIAHEALSAALASTRARGGDLIVSDPRTGEILAMVSVNGARTDVLSTVNTSYEPGSTLKPFTVATILQHRAGRLSDSIDTGKGEWTVGGRRLTDTSAHGMVSLADALRVSSNVGIAKAASALDAGDQYQTLRDFGFGMQAGVPLPGEVSGLLRRPERWSAQSQASLSIGYEISVTPLQMAMAYGALANDGVLMEPRVLREVRTHAGALIERSEPRAVRRVVSAEVAREVGEVLVQAVEDGTGKAARMEAFQVAGKTGTARAYSPETGSYSGRYFSSFAAFFPADDPQLVVFVKLDSPQGAYYGGTTAAPVSRAAMEAALATWKTPLDRQALMRSARRTPPPAEVRLVDPRPAASPVRFATAELPALATEVLIAAGVPMSGQLLASWPADGSLPVPDVAGLAPRVAVRRLHAAGLRVVWDGGGKVVGSAPSAGSRALPGDTVRLLTRSGQRQ